MAQVGSLNTSLTLESRQFVVGLKKAAEQTRDSVGNIEKGFNRLRVVAEATAAALALDAVVDVARRALDHASSLGEVSQQLGVTTKDLQVYRYAASQAGIEQETMDKALAKLTVTLGKARDGVKAPAEAFRELSKLAGRDIVASSQNAGDAIPLIAEALSKVDDPAKRARLEVELFGKAGQKLDTLLAGGRGQIDELRNAAERLGLVISDEFIARADDAADKLAAMKQVLEARVAAIVAENANSIVELADGTLRLATAINTFFSTDPERAMLIMGALAGGAIGGRAGGLPGAAVGAFAGGALGYSNAPQTAASRQRRLGEIDAQLRAKSPGLFGLGAGGQSVGGDLRKELLAERARLLEQNRAEFVAGLPTIGETVARFRGDSRPGGTGFGGIPTIPPSRARSGGRSKTEVDPFASAAQDARNALDALRSGPTELGQIEFTLDKESSAALRKLFELSSGSVDLTTTGESLSDAQRQAEEYLQNFRSAVAEVEDERARLMDDTTRSAATLYQSLFTGGTKALWDDFQSIGTEVIAKLLAQFTIAQLTGKGFSLAGALPGVLTSVGFGGFFANGGRPPVGKASIVGERGPEIFLPDVSGSIIPNHALGGTTIQQNFDMRGAIVDRDIYADINRISAAHAQQAMVGAVGETKRQMAHTVGRKLGRG